MPAWTMPTSRASPSIALPRITQDKPASRATLAAASRDFCGVATRRFATFARRGSPGFGVSEASSRKCIATAAGISMPYFVSTASASARVDTSGTVGPDAMMERSSPGTSEIASATTRAGAAATARRPPLIADKCFRTVFISAICAPHFSKARLTACLSASVIPSAGKASSAEPPPEIRTRTRSSAVSPDTLSRILRAAFDPASSGTGCDASTTSMYLHGMP